MKARSAILAVCLGLLLGTGLRAQQKDEFLPFIVENGDTTYIDELIPSWSFPKWNRNSKEYKEYVRLLFNFNKVYPYAQVGKELLLTVDDTMAGKKMGRLKKERYVTSVQNQLLKDFDKDIRRMTISQGKLLMKLIDREIGKTSYAIVKDYKNGIAAGFWQGIAKMFDNDLKSEYDPEGEDRDLEQLVLAWQDGSFPALYRSIFWEDPPEVKVPDFYKK